MSHEEQAKELLSALMTRSPRQHEVALVVTCFKSIEQAQAERVVAVEKMRDDVIEKCGNLGIKAHALFDEMFKYKTALQSIVDYENADGLKPRQNMPHPFDVAREALKRTRQVSHPEASVCPQCFEEYRAELNGDQSEPLPGMDETDVTEKDSPNNG